MNRARRRRRKIKQIQQKINYTNNNFCQPSTTKITKKK